MMRIGRDGYVCAQATGETAGSAAALAVRCRNARRESFVIRLDPKVSSREKRR
jgi:hypothetical protein